MSFKFTKMHGLGNDFMVIDAITQSISLTSEMISQMADRRLGVGFDQLLLVEPPELASMDFFYKIYNADGTVAEHCGNGARCFAMFVYKKKLIGRRSIRVQTFGNHLKLLIQDNGDVLVEMGIPNLIPSDIPFLSKKQSQLYEVDCEGENVEISAVSIGNPHAVLIVNNVQTAPVKKMGRILEKHSLFPNRCNVGFMQIINRKEIALRVFERGVGETPACGSGACAAVVAGQMQGLLDEEVSVYLPGGQLTVFWKGNGYSIFLSGTTTTVYDGVIQP